MNNKIGDSMNKLGIPKKRLISLIVLWFGCVFIFIAVTLTVLELNEKKMSDSVTEDVLEEKIEKRKKIDLLEKMNRSNYIFKDIVINEAYIEYNSKYYSFNGSFITNKSLKNYEFIIVIKDENNVEITRYTKVIEEAFRGEELLMYEEFGIELDSAVSFEIIEK